MIDLDSIPAGAVLDRLVAERVMGWHDIGDGWWRESAEEHAPQAGVGGFSAATHGNSIYAECIFQPSEDIAHAWAVVERIRALGWLAVDIRSEREGWSCVCIRNPRQPSGRVDRATADSAPLAICQAAVRAMAL